MPWGGVLSLHQLEPGSRSQQSLPLSSMCLAPVATERHCGLVDGLSQPLSGGSTELGLPWLTLRLLLSPPIPLLVAWGSAGLCPAPHKLQAAP